MAQRQDNLALILNRKIVAYKRHPSGEGFALKLDDGTIMDVSIDGDQYNEQHWLNIQITAPDDDQWVSIVAA